MVLVIVSRNIDLSVGSLVGVIAMAYALLMTDWLPNILGIAIGQPVMWILALALGLALGVGIGGGPGLHHRLHRRPSFIVTLGGLLSLRGSSGSLERRGGQRSERDLPALGGGATGSIGGTLTWVLAAVGCLAVVALLINNRRQRRRFGFPVRPMWAEVLSASSASWPSSASPRSPTPTTGRRASPSATRQQNGIAIPPGGLQIPSGLPVAGHPPCRRDHRDDIPGHPAEVRALRLRLRRQS